MVSKRASKALVSSSVLGFTILKELREAYFSEYQTLVGMVQRCHNPRNKSFRNYGAKGRSVCDRWRIGEDGKTGFECFLEDMGPKPAKNLSIDRINNDEGYRPDNCRWATASQQRANM